MGQRAFGLETMKRPSGNPDAGDAESLDAAFASCLPMLQRTARRVLRKKEDSDDAVQDGLLLAFKMRHQFEGRAKFSTWLHTIVLNAARSKLRRMASRQWVRTMDGCPNCDNDDLRAEILVDRGLNPEELCAREERARLLGRMLSQLRPSHRVAVQLCKIDGLQEREAAQILGVSVSALKTRLHRASRALVANAKKSRATIIPFRQIPVLRLSDKRSESKERPNVAVRGCPRRRLNRKGGRYVRKRPYANPAFAAGIVHVSASGAMRCALGHTS